MGSLFQGTPQTATSYTTSSTETPKWMQDAIYNQIQLATGVANAPYQAYSMPRVAEFSPLQQQAYQQVQQNQGAFQPAMNLANLGTQSLSEQGTAGALGAAQGAYLQPELAAGNLASGQGLYGRAGDISVTGAAQPYMAAASRSAADTVGGYMNPYNEAVTNRIAQLGTRNLSENLLPAVSDQFIRAGQFGSGRMGEFGSRALRDTQESILGQQAQALQQGYGQALGAAQTDLSRQAQLGASAGSLAGQEMSGLGSLGTALTQAGQQQQQLGLGAATAMQGAQAGDINRQLGALQQLANLQLQGQQMRTADVAALESAGIGEQSQLQRQLDAAYSQYQDQMLYPQRQLDWLSTQVRGMAPITPTVTTQSGSTTGATYSPSPLSQLAAGLYTYKGLTG
jgi:hypothetical protein